MVSLDSCSWSCLSSLLTFLLMLEPVASLGQGYGLICTRHEDCNLIKNLICGVSDPRTSTKLCTCIPGTHLDNSSGNSNNTFCRSPWAYLSEPCGSLAVLSSTAPKECSSAANLMCDVYLTQFSKCKCIPGTSPNEYTKECESPSRLIPLGSPCNVNATEDEETCEGEFGLCIDGICDCDLEDGAVLSDTKHKDCYLKVNKRHTRFKNSGTRLNNDVLFLRLLLALILVLSLPGTQICLH